MNKKKVKSSSSSGNERTTRSQRKRQADMEKKKEEAIKRKRNVDTANENVIGPNDIIVHGTGNVVKVEPEEDSTSVTVKEEADPFFSGEMESTGFHVDAVSAIKTEISDTDNYTFAVVEEEFIISNSDSEDTYEENTNIQSICIVSCERSQESVQQLLHESTLSIDQEHEVCVNEVLSESSQKEIPEDRLESTSTSIIEEEEGENDHENKTDMPENITSDHHPNSELLAADQINNPEMTISIADEPQENVEMDKMKEELHKMKTEMVNLQEILKNKDSETSSLREIIKENESEKGQYEKQLSQKNAVIEELLDGEKSRKELLEKNMREIEKMKEAVKESVSRKVALRSLKEKEDEINKLNKLLQENEDKIGELNKVVEETITKKDEVLRTLKEKVDEINTLQQLLQDNQKEIENLKESFAETISEKENALQSLKEKDDEINKLNARLDENNKNVENMTSIIDARKCENENLTELVNEQKEKVNKSVQIVEKRDKEIETMKLCLEKAERDFRSRQNAVSELPPEVWKAIPKKLENASDYNATVKLFTLLLEQQKNICLFDEVLQIFVRNGNEGQTAWSSKMPVLLKCRTICKRWKKSVDHVLGQHPSHFALCESGLSLKIFKQYFTPPPVLFLLSKDTLGMEKIPRSTFENFKAQQQQNPYYNPLPSRHLMIQIISDPLINVLSPGNWNKFHDSISTYLETFGRQVCYFTLHIFGNFLVQTDHILTYMCLCNWLQLLPNVQSLALAIHHSGLLQEMQSQIEELHYPELPDLITFQSETDTDNFFVHYFLKKNPHIQRLRFLASDDVTKIMEVKLPHLQELSMYVPRSPKFLKNDPLPWNVKKLTIVVGKKVSCTSLRISLMRTLHLHDNAIEYLKMVLPSFGMFGCRFVLPNLKHLHIKVNSSWINMARWHHFFAGLNSLENLTLDLTVITSKRLSVSLNYNNKAAFWKYIKTFHQAHRWLNFPQLKTVKLSVNFGGQQVKKCSEYFVKRLEMPMVKFNVICVGDIVHFQLY